MSAIRPLTDSTVNMPIDLVKEHQITVVPVYVNFGNKSYKDYVDSATTSMHMGYMISLRKLFALFMCS